MLFIILYFNIPFLFQVFTIVAATVDITQSKGIKITPKNLYGPSIASGPNTTHIRGLTTLLPPTLHTHNKQTLTHHLPLIQQILWTIKLLHHPTRSPQKVGTQHPVKGSLGKLLSKQTTVSPDTFPLSPNKPNQNQVKI